MMKKKVINAIGQQIEEIAQKKAGKCMLFVYQPKIPKVLKPILNPKK